MLFTSFQFLALFIMVYGLCRAILLILRHRLADMPNLETVVLEADNLCLLQAGVDRKDFSEFYAWGLSRNDLPLS